MRERNNYQKLLASGIYVNSDDYYALLMWKDHNRIQFNKWVLDNNAPLSINAFTQKQFDELVELSGIKS